MRRDDPEADPVTEAEAEAARRLAEAVDGGDGAGADAEALAAVRLLAALRERPADEVSARRGAALAALALRSATRRRLAVRLLTPLAAALVLAAGLAGRKPVPSPSGEALVAEREEAARAAVAALARGASSLRSQRAESLLATLSASRFEGLRRERAATLGKAGVAAPVPSETPLGGRT